MSDPLLPDLESLRVRVEQLTLQLDRLMSKPVEPADVWAWRDLAREYAIFVADMHLFQARAEETTTKPQAHVDNRADADDSRTGGQNELLPAVLSSRFIPKRACEGAVVINSNGWCQCPHPQCGVRVAADLIDNPFFGFAGVCPFKDVAKARESKAPGSVSTVNDGERIETKRDTQLP